MCIWSEYRIANGNDNGKSLSQYLCALCTLFNVKQSSEHRICITNTIARPEQQARKETKIRIVFKEPN